MIESKGFAVCLCGVLELVAGARPDSSHKIVCPFVTVEA